MRRVALALALALAAPRAGAQELRAGLLIPWPMRTDALHTAVVTATPRAAGPHEVRAHLRRFWPAQELNVAHATGFATHARTLTLPIPFGPNDDGSVSLRPEEATGALASGNPGNPRNATPNFIAVLGLGAGRAAQLDDGSTDSSTVAALVARTPEGSNLFAPLPSAWGGAQAIVTDTGTLLDAPADALATLDDWVHAGGVLAFTARSAADLRHPWLRARVGEVSTDEAGRATSPVMREGYRVGSRRFGLVRPVGLGAVALLDGDLSLERDDAATREALLDFRSAVGVGGGLVAPGDLSLWRRLEDRGVQRRMRGPSDLRSALVPIAIALTLYVIAVGVVLSRNRARKDPLRVFLSVPAAGLAILAAVFGLSLTIRAHRSSARVVCVWDLGAGARRAALRRFGAITAARPQSFSMRPGAGEVALIRTSAASAGGVLRWDGARLAVEGARLGLWETAMLYTEGVVDAGGEITLSGRDGRVVVENRSAMDLREPVVVLGDDVLRLPAVPAGGRAEVPLAQRERVHRGQPLVRDGLRWAGAPLTTMVLEDILGDLRTSGGPAHLVARVPVDGATRAMLSAAGFPAIEGEALIRVAAEPEGDPRVRAPNLPRSRVGPRTWAPPYEEPAAPTADADAGADGGDAR